MYPYNSNRRQASNMPIPESNDIENRTGFETGLEAGGEIALRRPQQSSRRPDNRPGEPPHRPDRPGEPSRRPDRPGEPPRRPDNRPGEPPHRPDRPGEPPRRPDNRPGEPPRRPDNRPGEPPRRPDNRPGEPPRRPDNRPSEPPHRPDRPRPPFDPPHRPDRPIPPPPRPEFPPKYPIEPPHRPVHPIEPPGRPPNFRPPVIIPARGSEVRSVSPSSLRNCIGSLAYVWFKSGRSSWFYIMGISRDTVIGYIWTKMGWMYTGFDADSIEGFFCQG